MSLLRLSEILGLFVNLLTADHKDSLCIIGTIYSYQFKRKTLRNKKPSLNFLPYLPNLSHFEKKMTLIAYVFPKLGTAKDVFR